MRTQFKKVLRGSEGGSSEPDVEIPRYVHLVQAGKLNLDGIVTHKFPFDRINRAIDLVRTGEAGRVLIRMAAWLERRVDLTLEPAIHAVAAAAPAL